MQAYSVILRSSLTTAVLFASQNCLAQIPPAIDWNALPDEKVSVTVQARPPGGGPSTMESKVLFSRHYAVSFSFDPEARYDDHWKAPVVFDLAQLTWYHAGGKQWIPLAKCREWEQASIERSRVSLVRETDPDIKAFVEATINPRLQLQKMPDGSIELSNSHMKYTISPAANVLPHQLDRFIRYDHLNAYHKAMNTKLLPPTVQIAVDNVLVEQRMFPKQMTTAVKTGKGELIFAMDIRTEAFTPSDANEIRSALADIQP